MQNPNIVIEWLASMNAMLFGATGFAMAWRVAVYGADGAKLKSLKVQIAAGAAILFFGCALLEGRRWILWHSINAGAVSFATVGASWMGYVADVLTLIGALIFVRSATVEECGEKVWIISLIVAVICEAAIRVGA